VKVQARNRIMLAWLLFAATFACLAAGLAVTLALVRPLTVGVLAGGALAALLYLGFAVLGLILSLRRPANPIGWLYAASGLVWSLSVPGDAWVDNLIRQGRPLPLAAQFEVAIGEPRWALAIALGVTLPLLLLPDGRLRSRRWRPAVWASVAGAVLVEVAGSLAPGQLDSWPIANPIGLGGVAGAVANVLESVGLVLHVSSLAAALVCLVLRFRSSRGVERQQLRWVAAGATGTVVGLLAVVRLGDP
jgi:two-component system, NarL family, sensor kinase